MKNLTIKTRLMAVISFLSLLLIVIGAYGLWGMSQSNDDLRDVYEEHFMPADRLARVNIYNAENLRQVHLMLMHDPRVPESKLHDHPLSFHTDQMTENVKLNNKYLEAYEAKEMPPEETAMYEEYKAKRKAHQVVRNKTLDLIHAGDFGGAMISLVRELGPAFVAQREVLHKLFEYQTQQAELAHEKSDQAYKTTRIISIGSIVVGVLLALFIGIMLMRAIMRPLETAQEVAGRIASGDLTSNIEIKSNDELGKLLTSFKAMQDSIQSLIHNIRDSTETISTASQEIADGNNDLSQRTEEQASSLEETASSMEELTSTVRQNAENAKQANHLAVSASDIAVKGGAAVGDVVHTMASISTSSKKIVDIISVIEGIAFQTNILALNAAVEAARAGEQGRGFAVVAGEVRNLAQRSAAAAKEIKTLIDDSVNKVDAGSKQVDQAGATMTEIVQAVKRVTDIMSEIAAASNEQTAGIEQVNIAITQMDEVTQQNAALVEESAAAAESMKEQAEILMRAVSIFKLEASRAMARATAQPVEQHAIAHKAAAHHSAAHAAPAPVGSTRKLVNKAKADQDGDWKEF